MAPQEFITWFKGFVAATHQYNVTPGQWDQVKDQLARVQDEPITKAYWQATTTTVDNPAENKVTYFTNDNKKLLHD